MSAKIVDLDIRQANRIDGFSEYNAVEILFRSGRDPIVRARISCNGDTLEHEKLSPFLENLPLPVVQQLPDEPLPTVTVAVCTKDRRKELAIALNSLARQDYEPKPVVVISKPDVP